MNLVVTTQFTGVLATNDISKLGRTAIGSGESQVNSSNIFVNTTTRRDLVARPSNLASYGTMYGRVGAHEVITHGFLGTSQHPASIPFADIRNPSDPYTLRARSNPQWNIDSATAAALKAKCP
jgi:hypothetical protein